MDVDVVEASKGQRGESSKGTSMIRAEGWKPYKSVLKSLTPRKRQRLSDATGGAEDEEGMIKVQPPWRRKVGSCWFSLDSMAGIGEALTETEADEFARIMEDTFRNFSEEVIGPPPREDGDWSGGDGDVSFKVDVTPQRMVIVGEREFDPDKLFEESKPSHRPIQTCWNCDEPGHAVPNCPEPRNHTIINARRAAFQAEREAVPESAMQWLRDYKFTEKERARRLELVDRFIPGRISKELADAIFYVEDQKFFGDASDGEGEEGEISAWEEEREMMERKKDRGEWPWLYWMFKWGYPPGWFCEEDPIPVIRQRLREMQVDPPDEGELLKIFGGDLGSPSDSRSKSPSSTSDDTSGIPITPNRKVSPSSGLLVSPGSSSDMSLEIESPEKSKTPHRSSFSTPSPPPPPPPPPPESSPPPMPPSPDHSLVTNIGPFQPLPNRPGSDRAPPTAPSWMRLGHKGRLGLPTGPKANITWAPKKWAHYPTHLFDSSRLKVYTTARPLPLGF